MNKRRRFKAKARRRAASRRGLTIPYGVFISTAIAFLKNTLEPWRQG